jgi:hypothetical protein
MNPKYIGLFVKFSDAPEIITKWSSTSQSKAQSDPWFKERLTRGPSRFLKD